MPGEQTRGLYGALDAALLERWLQGRPDGPAIFPALDKAAAPDVFAQYVAKIAWRLLSDNNDGARRQDLVNRLVDLLEVLDDDAVIKLEELLPISVALDVYEVRPASLIYCAALLEEMDDEPSPAAEVQGEMASADVDLFPAFVWRGMRLLPDQLDDLKRRGKPLRAITTADLGDTKGRAFDEPGVSASRRSGPTAKARDPTTSQGLVIPSPLGSWHRRQLELSVAPSYRRCANWSTAVARAGPCLN